MSDISGTRNQAGRRYPSPLPADIEATFSSLSVRDDTSPSPSGGAGSRDSSSLAYPAHDQDTTDRHFISKGALFCVTNAVEEDFNGYYKMFFFPSRCRFTLATRSVRDFGGYFIKMNHLGQNYCTSRKRQIWLRKRGDKFVMGHHGFYRSAVNRCYVCDGDDENPYLIPKTGWTVCTNTVEGRDWHSWVPESASSAFALRQMPIVRYLGDYVENFALLTACFSNDQTIGLPFINQLIEFSTRAITSILERDAGQCYKLQDAPQGLPPNAIFEVCNAGDAWCNGYYAVTAVSAITAYKNPDGSPALANFSYHKINPDGTVFQLVEFTGGMSPVEIFRWCEVDMLFRIGGGDKFDGLDITYCSYKSERATILPPSMGWKCHHSRSNPDSFTGTSPAPSIVYFRPLDVASRSPVANRNPVANCSPVADCCTVADCSPVAIRESSPDTFRVMANQGRNSPISDVHRQSTAGSIFPASEAVVPVITPEDVAATVNTPAETTGDVVVPVVVEVVEIAPVKETPAENA